MLAYIRPSFLCVFLFYVFYFVMWGHENKELLNRQIHLILAYPLLFEEVVWHPVSWIDPVGRSWYQLIPTTIGDVLTWSVEPSLRLGAQYSQLHRVWLREHTVAEPSTWPGAQLHCIETDREQDRIELVPPGLTGSLDDTRHLVSPSRVQSGTWSAKWTDR